MSIVSADNLGLAFGAHVVFTRCRCRVSAGDRIGLVGPNGSGKSSLLRLLAGLEQPTSGVVSRARSSRIAYVGQRPELDGKRTAYEEVAEVFLPLRAMEDELLLAGETLADSGAGNHSAALRYQELSLRFEHEGGYTYEAEIRRTLRGLGVTPQHWHQRTESLSGGEQARVALAKALLERPDLLLLDEPTNHLDLGGLAWLENLLAAWTGAYLVVSHDRFFLDQVVTNVWEAGETRLTAYRGDYSAYAMQRDERLKRQRDLYQEQQELIARQEQLIRRYGAGQRAKWAKGLEKRLGRVERLDAPSETAKLQMKLGAGARGGRVGLTLEKLMIARPSSDEELIRLPRQLEVERGARVGIVGPNGCGKTTLLRTIAGEVPPLSGRVLIGHAVTHAYHRQGMEDLRDEVSVLEEFLVDADLDPQDARDLLAKFLFRGDDVRKQVGFLSGGERSRLALAKLAVTSANLLLLDEPTNHLDIGAREALERVLVASNASILFVSHDRRFIDAIASELWLIEDGVLRAADGNFSENLATRLAVPSGMTGDRPRPRQAPRPKRAGPDHAHYEETAGALDARLSALRLELDLASTRRDAAEIARVGRLYVETESALNGVLADWEEASPPAGTPREGVAGPF